MNHGHINMKPNAASENTKIVAVPYRVLTPVRMTLAMPDGSHVIMGYGIGDIIEVMEPAIQYANCRHEELKEIPLSDGSFIIGYDDRLRLTRVDRIP